ncbi:hypothetical protein TNCV_933791 [Trichonephila clavipes]|nr:hypothetical protein TNCV_933791 [Trichonephila clavipes]
MYRDTSLHPPHSCLIGMSHQLRTNGRDMTHHHHNLQAFMDDGYIQDVLRLLETLSTYAKVDPSILH